MTESEIAWAAGFFEGEGCMSFRNTNCVTLLIGSTDLDALEKMQSICGGSIYGGKMKPKSTKPIWTWQLSKTEEVHAVLVALEPWFCSRRAEKARESISRLEVGMAAKEITHGTVSGWSREKYRGLPICDECKQAYKDQYTKYNNSKRKTEN